MGLDWQQGASRVSTLTAQRAPGAAGPAREYDCHADFKNTLSQLFQSYACLPRLSLLLLHIWSTTGHMWLALVTFVDVRYI
jgi:hypothetical protein